MKLLIDKKILQEGLNYVSRALSTRNIIPVLNGIKFDVKKSGLTLTATDNDISIEYKILKKDIKSIEEEGCLVIYSKTLMEAIKKIDSEDLIIESFEDNEVTIKTNYDTCKIQCFDKVDFPNIKFEEQKECIKVDALKFKEMVSNTTFACSLQESRAILTGINIKLTGNVFECIATDSYRLSKMSVKIENKDDNNYNIVIPSRNISELIKIIDKEEIIELHILTTKILFKLGNILFQSSLLNGTFPNTDNSIASDFNYKMKINRKKLLNKADLALTFTSSSIEIKNIIELEIKDSILNFKATGVGDKLENGKLEIENLTNNCINVAVSAKYLLEALKVFKEENVYLLLNGEINPIIIKEENNDELIELVLPMRIY